MKDVRPGALRVAMSPQRLRSIIQAGIISRTAIRWCRRPASTWTTPTSPQGCGRDPNLWS